MLVQLDQELSHAQWSALSVKEIQFLHACRENIHSQFSTTARPIKTAKGMTVNVPPCLLDRFAEDGDVAISSGVPLDLSEFFQNGEYIGPRPIPARCKARNGDCEQLLD